MHTIMVIGGGLVLLAIFILVGRQLGGGDLVAVFAGRLRGIDALASVEAADGNDLISNQAAAP